MNEPAVFQVCVPAPGLTNVLSCSLVDVLPICILAALTEVFSLSLQTLSKTMPETNIHLGDKELGGRQNHLHYHNVWLFSFAMLCVESNASAVFMFQSLMFRKHYNLLKKNDEQDIIVYLLW